MRKLIEVGFLVLGHSKPKECQGKIEEERLVEQTLVGEKVDIVLALLLSHIVSHGNRNLMIEKDFQGLE